MAINLMGKKSLPVTRYQDRSDPFKVLGMVTMILKTILFMKVFFSSDGVLIRRVFASTCLHLLIPLAAELVYRNTATGARAHEEFNISLLCRPLQQHTLKRMYILECVLFRNYHISSVLNKAGNGKKTNVGFYIHPGLCKSFLQFFWSIMQRLSCDERTLLLLKFLHYMNIKILLPAPSLF